MLRNPRASVLYGIVTAVFRNLQLLSNIIVTQLLLSGLLSAQVVYGACFAHAAALPLRFHLKGLSSLGIPIR